MLLLLVFYFSFWAVPAPAQVSVIAHPSVPAETIRRAQLLDLYTGDVKLWGNGVPVVVFDLRPKSPVKEQFYDFLGKTTSRMKSIWLKKKLAGESDPPEAAETEEEMLEKVRTTPGAVGFVSHARVNGSVKVLTVIPEKGSP